MDIKAGDIIVYECGRLIVTEVLGSAQLWELDTIAAYEEMRDHEIELALDDMDDDADEDEVAAAAAERFQNDWSEGEAWDLRECDDAEMLSVGTAYRVAWLDRQDEACIFTDGKFIFFDWNAVLITGGVWYHNSIEKFRSEPIVQVISGREAA